MAVFAALCVVLALAPSPEPLANDGGTSMRAKVVSTDESALKLAGVVEYGTQRLVVEMLEGPSKGRRFPAANELRAQLDIDKKFAAGDTASVVWPANGAGPDDTLTVRDHYRLGWGLVLLSGFVALLLAFGGWTGAKALFSFVFSCLAIWKLLIPLCLAGWDASWVSFLVVSVLTAVIMYLVAGATRKGLSAFVGAMLGVGEVKRHIPNLPRTELFLSGLRIGRSVVGTMTTTLLLAYSGGYLTLLMVFAVQGTRPLDFINSTLVSAEIVKTLVGSFGLVLVAPFTALVSAAVYGWRRMIGESKE